MNALLKLTLIDTKLFLRNMLNAFFLLVYPILMLLVFGAMYGNNPVDVFGGYGMADITVPGYIVALVLGTAGFLNLPIELVNYRERGILRRYRATPVKPIMVLGSQTVVVLAAALIGTALQFGFGRALYQVALPQAPGAVLLGFALICFSLFSFGFLIASLIKKTSSARTLGMAIYFPMMFLSGGAFPGEMMPESVTRFANFLPLTHAVSLFKDLWFGRGWDLTHVAVLAGVGLICTFVALKMFRWE